MLQDEQAHLGASSDLRWMVKIFKHLKHCKTGGGFDNGIVVYPLCELRQDCYAIGNSYSGQRCEHVVRLFHKSFYWHDFCVANYIFVNIFIWHVFWYILKSTPLFQSFQSITVQMPSFYDWLKSLPFLWNSGDAFLKVTLILWAFILCMSVIPSTFSLPLSGFVSYFVFFGKFNIFHEYSFIIRLCINYVHIAPSLVETLPLLCIFPFLFSVASFTS